LVKLRPFLPTITIAVVFFFFVVDLLWTIMANEMLSGVISSKAINTSHVIYSLVNESGIDDLLRIIVKIIDEF
jgi:hypothetical protein